MKPIRKQKNYFSEHLSRGWYHHDALNIVFHSSIHFLYCVFPSFSSYFHLQTRAEMPVGCNDLHIHIHPVGLLSDSFGKMKKKED